MRVGVPTGEPGKDGAKAPSRVPELSSLFVAYEWWPFLCYCVVEVLLFPRLLLVWFFPNRDKRHRFAHSVLRRDTHIIRDWYMLRLGSDQANILACSFLGTTGELDRFGKGSREIQKILTVVGF